MADAQQPVLVGVSQLIQRDVDPADSLSPLAMLEQVAAGAAQDAGLEASVLADCDRVGVIDVAAWRCGNHPGALAQQLGASPQRLYGTGIGGETPLILVNQLAHQIASGESRMALVAGANNIKSLKALLAQGVKPGWEVEAAGEPIYVAEKKMGNSDHEAKYGLESPPAIYPVFENALRARRGLDLEAHRRRVGALLSRFTEVAAKNPYAWFPVARSADEITRPSANNRMVAFPYTKYMNAIIDVDQAAGLLLMSAAAAKEYGIPEDRQIHWWGGAHAVERTWYMSQRPSFSESPALRTAANAALERAGVGLDQIDLFDFYSCFAVAVEMACEMLGLDEADPRGLTLTGGLPYAGGPANNYTVHSLATAVARLREGAGRTAFVTGNGWYLTKHAGTVLATTPREAPLVAPEPVAPPAEPEAVPLLDAADGPATIETYTVLYGRDGAPERGIVIGRLDETGGRFIANTPADRSLLEAFVRVENVGRRGRVRSVDGANRFEPA